MEVNSSQKGFELKDGKIPILVTLKKTQDLRPHEEVVPSDLQGLVQALNRDPVLRHPVIADSATGVVLDGTHRLRALSQLRCVLVPTALIDYQNPLVQVDRWFRMISGESLRSFRKRIEPFAPILVSPTEAEQGLLNRASYTTLQDEDQCLAFKAHTSKPLELAREAFGIEQIARDKALKISYTDNGDMSGSSGPGFLMSTICLEKREVIDSSLQNALFPPKTTRHLIPSRPLAIGIPLVWLQNKNIGEAQTMFLRHLNSKSVRRLRGGSWVGSRRYQEEVFVFE